MNKNPECCGGHCRKETGEVRLYPLGGGANLILCIDCWIHENDYRRARGDPSRWPTLNWDTAKVGEHD